MAPQERELAPILKLYTDIRRLREDNTRSLVNNVVLTDCVDRACNALASHIVFYFEAEGGEAAVSQLDLTILTEVSHRTAPYLLEKGDLASLEFLYERHYIILTKAIDTCIELALPPEVIKVMRDSQIHCRDVLYEQPVHLGCKFVIDKLGKGDVQPVQWGLIRAAVLQRKLAQDNLDLGISGGRGGSLEQRMLNERFGDIYSRLQNLLYDRVSPAVSNIVWSAENPVAREPRLFGGIPQDAPLVKAQLYFMNAYFLRRIVSYIQEYEECAGVLEKLKSLSQYMEVKGTEMCEEKHIPIGSMVFSTVLDPQQMVHGFAPNAPPPPMQ